MVTTLIWAAWVATCVALDRNRDLHLNRSGVRASFDLTGWRLALPTTIALVATALVNA